MIRTLKKALTYFDKSRRISNLIDREMKLFKRNKRRKEAIIIRHDPDYEDYEQYSHNFNGYGDYLDAHDFHLDCGDR